MKRMTALLLAAALLLGMLITAASADRMYLIPDSETRKLTEEELWGWDYESIGYIMNEIFARHGYVFQSGGKYEYYFNCMPWYEAGVNKTGHAYTTVEWDNQNLCKKVRQDMRDQNTTNPGGKSVWTDFDSGFSGLQGFDYVDMKQQSKTLPVFSAPNKASWRGGNGKAAVSTVGAVLVAGEESGWHLVMYETNSGGVRVGYVEGGKPMNNAAGTIWNRELFFEYKTATVTHDCVLTDDPIRQTSVIRNLKAGDKVTYLTTFFSNTGWDYVETTADNGLVSRGFIPAQNLDQGLEDSDQDAAVGEEVG